MPLTPKCEGLLLQQGFCLTGKVQRHVGKITIFPIPTLGEPDCMLRLMFRNESLERRRRLIFAALGFDRDDLRAVLDHEVDLTALVSIVLALPL